MVTSNVIIINTVHYMDIAVYMEVRPNGVLDPKVHVDGCENKMSLPLRNDVWTGNVLSLNHTTAKCPATEKIDRRKQGHGLRHSKAAYLSLLW
jgi:hypothetical protein